MATPTEAEIKTFTANAFDLLDEGRKFAGVSTPNFISLEDTLVQSLETDFADDITAGAASLRSSLNTYFSSGTAMLDGCFRTYGQFINAPETNSAAILARLYDYYVANTLRVTSRQFTFGAVVAAGGNVGNGTINRLNLDENGFSIENQFADIKTFKCLNDKFSGGQEHAEIFEVRGSDASRDGLKLDGSGVVDAMTGISSVDASAFVTNPSFEGFIGDAATPTEITGWEVGTLANFVMDSVNTYRGGPDIEQPYAVRIEANDFLEQSFETQDADFDLDTPYYCQVAYNDQIGGASGGTITITMGDQTASATLTNSGGWKILRMAIGVKAWYKTFKATTPVFKIEITGLTGPYVLVDDFIVAPYVEFDNSWYALVGGSTAFSTDDSFTFTDTEVGAVIQYWLWRLYDVSLPSTTGGGVTWVDP